MPQAFQYQSGDRRVYSSDAYGIMALGRGSQAFEKRGGMPTRRSKGCMTPRAYVSGHFVGLRGHPPDVRKGKVIVFGLSPGFVTRLYSC